MLIFFSAKGKTKHPVTAILLTEKMRTVFFCQDKLTPL
jgi:hypothetical protein